MPMNAKLLPLESLAASVSVIRAGPQEIGGDAGRTPTMEGKKKFRVKDEPESESEPSPSMRLGLGICGGNAVAKHWKPLFTATQLHELQLQALVFKYIAAGLPVPPGLVLPIWKTGCSSIGSTGGDIFRQFTSFVQCSPWVLGLTDPEPWRCKRTDGKKWRCGKKVIPDQKYCERHMHRGRKRSRKLAEASQTAATAVDTTLSKDASQNLEKTNPKVSNLNPISSQLKSHKEPTISREIVKNISDASKININNSLDTGDENGGCANSVWSKNTLDRTSNRSDDRNGPSDSSLGLDFSPKSVLQVQACSAQCFRRINEELEPGRCRRTDGKKWRCRKDVLPKQKYCATHMHRGARKHAKASQSFVSPASIHNISSDAHGHPNEAHYRLDIKNSNKKFSISMSTNPKLMVNDDTDTDSMSSDKTISDTIAAYRETGSLSS